MPSGFEIRSQVREKLGFDHFWPRGAGRSPARKFCLFIMHFIEKMINHTSEYISEYCCVYTYSN